MSKPRTKSKRNETYRRDYFRNNKGFFGIHFCYLCKKPLTKSKVEVDHIIPISRFGGTNQVWNLGPLCRKCNRKKSNKMDHRMVIGLGTKLLNGILSIPFIILGMLFSVFTKLNGIMKVIVIGVLAVWLYTMFK